MKEVNVQMIIPIFRIFDIEKALEFYVDFLGFQVDWQHQFEEDMPLYLQVSLNEAVIHLSEHHGDATPGSAIRIKMENLIEYHALLAEKNYRYARPGIEDTAWGSQEVRVGDPFSNRITFYKN